MMGIRSAMAVAIVLSGLSPATAQLVLPERPPGAPVEANAEVQGMTRAILEEIDKNSELMANLEYLCDLIGPRLTGSEKLKRANEWTRDKFKEYGVDATLEGWKIGRSWTRGPARGRIVSPVEQRLIVESSGWSPSTDGPKAGPVVFIKAEKPADLDAFKGKLKGAWVLASEVSVQPSAKNPEPRAGRPAAGRRGNPGGARRLRTRLKTFLIEEQAAGLLRDSDKEHGLVDMTGATYDFSASRIPEAFLTNESYGLISRLQKRGPVEIEIELKNEFSEGEVEVFNTVAEIRGSEKPDEFVILGAHLDSWDLGTGATDNGTGSMAILEAARALKALGIKPKRTIRFVLFTGEEQGLHGSKAYAKAHEKELDKVSAVLVHDMGTGRVTSIGLQGRYDLREVMDRVVAPFQRDLKLDELSMRNMGGTDHLSFLPAGVPAFAVVQDPAEYRKTHHTESDTFEKVYADEINQGAKVLAAWAYNVAMLPDLLPRDPQLKTKAKPADPTPAKEKDQPKDQKDDSPTPAPAKPSEPVQAKANAGG